MLEVLISFAIATAILAISPGPDNIFVLTQSIVNGKKYGIATVLGLMSGCIVHTSFVAFGVSAILKKNENLFFIIKLFGAAYLLYLAYKVYNSDAKIVLFSPKTQKKSTLSLFKKGFLMNVLNPKVTLFFLAFFPQFLFSNTMATEIQFYILGLIFILISFIVFASIAILAGNISKYIKQYANIGVYLKWGQIVVFVAIAIIILM